jgi:serine/threonine protein kinase
MMWASRVYSKAAGAGSRSKFDLVFLGATASALLMALDSAPEENEETKHSAGPSSQRQVYGQIPASMMHSSRTYCQQQPSVAHRVSHLTRHSTVSKMKKTASIETLKSKYKVDWANPLGEGAFGAVYKGINRETGEPIAVKKMPKRITDTVTFQREMDALLHLREAGGHPNICGLRENFEEGHYYYLVIDLITGGEMFDKLCSHGPYSEADAARLVREVASALAFLHGIGIVHGDMKPENIMLSSESTSDAVIKLVDFGCAQVIDQESPFASNQVKTSVNTPAYCPPEVLKLKGKESNLDPTFDMWALGVIIYIMLTGCHPFDLYGDATDEEIEHAVLYRKRPPLHKSPITAHLSKDAIEVIENLAQWDPKQRLNANQLLHNPWVRGETASMIKIADSDKKLSAFRAFETKIAEKVFKDMLSFSQNAEEGALAKRTSLLEQSFQNLDPEHRGYITVSQLQKLAKDGSITQSDNSGDEQLSLSDFSVLLEHNMKNRYFPKGHVVYREGEIGNAMYFLNSGSVEVFNKDGFYKTLRQPGSFFGEGALLNRDKIRSASIKCTTPIHVIEISREYFEKYLAADMDVNLDLRARDKSRKRQRVKNLLQLQKNLQERQFSRGGFIFKAGDDAKDLYILKDGEVDLSVQDLSVFSVGPGTMLGEYSLLFGRLRNATATCLSDSCTLHVLPARDFHSLLESHPTLKANIRDICLRREFRKALCVATKKAFPRTENELRAAFDVLVSKSTGAVELETIRRVLHVLDSTYSEKEVRDILGALDLSESGAVEWNEFKRIFDMDDNER